MAGIYDIAIIGGGAAGLMAASFATEMLRENKPATLPKIALIEKMPRPGRKLNITGKGSCNLTNAKMWDEFAPHIHPNRQFLKNAFYNFSSAETMHYFENLGLELVTERGARVFPKSKKAMDVTDALVGSIKRGGIVELHTNCEVNKITKVLEGEREEEILFEIETNGGNKMFRARKILVATGGLSYPTTGSTGDGYKLANSFCHSISKCHPSLTALVPKDYGKLPLSGRLLLKNVSASLKIAGTIVKEEFGDLEFTDGGIEGPIGLRTSRRAVAALTEKEKVSLILDLKPAITAEQLEKRIASELQKRGLGNNNHIKENQLRPMLRSLLPNEMTSLFILKLKESAGKERYLLEIEQIAHTLKHLEFQICSYVGYERAVVTAGGVALKEISQKSMESKQQKNLYFAGEVLDIDGDTGGYNLQCAFSTAVLAIKSMLQK